MKTKKFLSGLCAAAVLLSVTAGAITLTKPWITHAEDITAEEVSFEEADLEEIGSGESGSGEAGLAEVNLEEVSALDLTNGEDDGDIVSDEPQVPATPQNVRVEDGYVVWDEDDAYGYYVRVYNINYDLTTMYYTNRVEINRYAYDHNMDFGKYSVEVCAFDESCVMGQYSEAITITYAPGFDAPTNVRLSEDDEYETLIWDEVENTARYNIKVYNYDDNTLYTWTWTTAAQISLNYCLGDSGNYWIKVQAMDKDYNVSEWTEPILVNHTAIIYTYLDTPTNLRFDESGENILWDEVEGADYYYLYLYSKVDDRYFSVYHNIITYQAQYDNWKSLAIPFSDGIYYIYVYAYNYQGLSSNNSDTITATYKPIHDESIEVANDMRLEDDHLHVDGADNNGYWLCISANDKILYDEYYHIDGTYDYNYYVYNRLPEGDYKAELFVIDENNNYNSISYSFTLDTVHDETVWVPELYYKFDDILWDYDRLRHDNTYYFWIRIKQGDEIIVLDKSYSEYYSNLRDLPNGDYTIDVCVYEYDNSLGEWSAPLNIKKHGDSFFDEENEYTTEVEPAPDAEGIPEDDRITTITINPAFNMKNKEDNNVELDLSKITVKAKEIYDEEGLQRASEALGQLIDGNTHYNLLDLTLLYDGEDFSNGYEGLVQVIIPLPKGHRDKNFSCYRLVEVDGKMVKEEIPGEQTEDSYIIYLEHFSIYAFVPDEEDDPNVEDHTHDYGDTWKSDENGHWKECSCGEKSEEAEHDFGDWTTVKEATVDEEGEESRECKICGWSETKTIDKITANPPEDTDPPKDTDPSDTGSSFTGSFQVPEITTGVTAATIAPPAETTAAVQPTADNTDVAADTNQTSANTESTYTETVQTVDSDTPVSTSEYNDDRNINTGVAAAAIPFAALAAAGIIIFKRKK